VNLEKYVSGLVGKPNDKSGIAFNGLSGKDGFYLDYTIGNETTRKTVGISEVESILLQVDSMRTDPKHVIVSRVIFILIQLGFYLTNLSWATLIVMFIINLICLPKLTLGIVASFSLIRKREVREWHSCEHKTIVFIENNLNGKIDSSFESFAECQELYIQCGINQGYLRFIRLLILYFWSIYIVLSIASQSIANNPISILVITVPIIIFILLLKDIKDKVYWNKLTVKRFVILLPLCIIPLLAERLLSLSTPSDKKLTTSYGAALRMLREIQVKISKPAN